MPPISTSPIFSGICGDKVNAETYACDFLQSRGFQARVDYDTETCVDLAAKVLVEELCVQLKLSDLRMLGAMAQWNEREMRHDVLQLIAVSGHLPGETWVSMDPTSVRIIPAHPAVLPSENVNGSR